MKTFKKKLLQFWEIIAKMATTDRSVSEVYVVSSQSDQLGDSFHFTDVSFSLYGIQWGQ